MINYPFLESKTWNNPTLNFNYWIDDLGFMNILKNWILNIVCCVTDYLNSVIDNCIIYNLHTCDQLRLTHRAKHIVKTDKKVICETCVNKYKSELNTIYIPPNPSDLVSLSCKMPPNITPNVELHFQKSALIFYVNGKKVSIH